VLLAWLVKWLAAAGAWPRVDPSNVLAFALPWPWLVPGLLLVPTLLAPRHRAEFARATARSTAPAAAPPSQG
jgi:hypothetical protein